MNASPIHANHLKLYKKAYYDWNIYNIRTTLPHTWNALYFSPSD